MNSDVQYITDKEASARYKQRRIEAREKGVCSREYVKNVNPHTACRDWTFEKKLQWLIAMSDYRLDPISFYELRKRRRTFDSTKNKKFPLIDVNGTPFKCWLCEEKEAKHRHHVVMLSNGGSVSARKNIILLCVHCHGRIHPWLSGDLILPAARRFEVERAKNNAAVLLEKIASEDKLDLSSLETQFLDIIRSLFNKIQTSSDINNALLHENFNIAV